MRTTQARPLVKPRCVCHFIVARVRKLIALFRPQYVAWISQLNTTYTDLTITGNYSGSTVQPGGEIYGNNTFPTINGTMYVSFFLLRVLSVIDKLSHSFILVTDDNPYVTPFNLTMLNAHVVAGPAMYQSG